MASPILAKHDTDRGWDKYIEKSRVRYSIEYFLPFVVTRSDGQNPTFCTMYNVQRVQHHGVRNTVPFLHAGTAPSLNCCVRCVRCVTVWSGVEEIEDPSKSIRPPSGNIGQVHRSTWSQNVTQNDLCHCLSPLPFITSSYVHCLRCALCTLIL